MKFLMSIMMSLCFVTSAFAGEMCEFTESHRCVAENDARLANLTRNTIHVMQYTQPEHPFLTENDRILEQAATSFAQNNTAPAGNTSIYLLQSGN